MDIRTASSFSKLFSNLTAKNIRTPEEILSHNLAIWLRNEALSGFPLVFFHVPNESFTSYSYAAKLNALGRISGAPDFVVASNGKVVFLELKAPATEKRKPKLTENQRAFQEWAALSGVPYFIVDSMKDAKYVIKEHLLGITNLGVLSDAQDVE